MACRLIYKDIYHTYNIMKNYDNHTCYKMSFASIYTCYIEKAEIKEKTKEEVDILINWLTGYNNISLQKQIDDEVDLETFFDQAPEIHPNASLIKGVICWHRIEEIDHPLMRNIRYMDKLIDELARGRKMEKILRVK